MDRGDNYLCLGRGGKKGRARCAVLGEVVEVVIIVEVVVVLVVQVIELVVVVVIVFAVLGLKECLVVSKELSTVVFLVVR